MTSPQVLLGALLSAVVAAAAPSCDLPTVSLTVDKCDLSPSGQTAIHSYGVSLVVGNTTVCAVPSTVVNASLWEHRDSCSGDAGAGMTPAECNSRRGGRVSETDLSELMPKSHGAVLADTNPTWRDLMSGFGYDTFQYSGTATIRLRPGLPPFSVDSGLISQGRNHTNSHIGLAESSTFLQGARDANLIGHLSWGLDAGSQSHGAPRKGRLVLGGYDPDAIEGGQFSQPPYRMAREKVYGRACPLMVDVAKIVVTSSNSSDERHSIENPLPACVEP